MIIITAKNAQRIVMKWCSPNSWSICDHNSCRSFQSGERSGFFTGATQTLACPASSRQKRTPAFSAGFLRSPGGGVVRPPPRRGGPLQKIIGNLKSRPRRGLRISSLPSSIEFLPVCACVGARRGDKSTMSPEVNLPAGPHVAGGELAAAGSETQFLFGARTYRAFISYSHADSAWARWLVRRLENFKVPERFHGLKAPIGQVGARIAPVFRDRDELPTTSDLGETIRTALRQSATLVVICSPASAKSRWVQEEILAFKRMGGSARVFAFIVGGEPKAAGTSEDCFSPALRAELGADGNLSANPAEHVAADARSQGDGKEDAF